MFGFLKEKLKSALNVFSKNVDQEGTEEVIEKPVKEKKNIESIKDKPEKKEISKKKSEKKVTEEIIAKPEKKEISEKKINIEPTVEEKEIIEDQIVETEATIADEVAPEKEFEEPLKKSFFGKITEKITTKKISADTFDELFTELEFLLLENNVSLEVVDKIKADLKEEMVDKPLPRSQIIDTITKRLAKSIDELFSVPTFDLVAKTKTKKPLVIAFIGVNGSGKTTQLAKIANLFQKNNKSCVIAACDTFRAAAIQQLEAHAQKLNIKMIKHDYGADPAAVAFDAIEHAKAKNIDVVLLDTAGRLHSNSNLMDELRKIVRVAKPDITLFVGESITGNDCVEQAVQFGNAIPLDGIILTKADVDEKGGAAISISYVTGKPILFLGTGQGYDDIEPFDKEIIVQTLGF